MFSFRGPGRFWAHISYFISGDKKKLFFSFLIDYTPDNGGECCIDIKYPKKDSSKIYNVKDKGNYMKINNNNNNEESPDSAPGMALEPSDFN